MKKSCFKGCFCSKAFTLIELLVVVLIIGILVAVAVPQYQKAVLKSRYMQLVVLQDSITKAEEIYRLANGKYTDNLAELDIELPGGTVTYDEQQHKSHWTNSPYQIVLSSAWSQGYVKRMSHVVVHQTEGRYCRSYNRTDLEKSVCKALGGVERSCADCEYDEFRLP